MLQPGIDFFMPWDKPGLIRELCFYHPEDRPKFRRMRVRQLRAILISIRRRIGR